MRQQSAPLSLLVCSDPTRVHCHRMLHTRCERGTERLHQNFSLTSHFSPSQ